jgi:hypothetical protein
MPYVGSPPPTIEHPEHDGKGFRSVSNFPEMLRIVPEYHTVQPY